MSTTEVIQLVLRSSETGFFVRMTIPLAVTLIALLIFSRQVSTMTKKINRNLQEMLSTFQSKISSTTKSELNESLGSFRVEIRKILDEEENRSKAHIASSPRSVEANAEAQSVKLAEAQRRSLDQPTALSEDLAPAEEREGYEKNWGELQAMWADVWLWSKEQLDEALSKERRGVVIGKLRNARLTSPSEVISMLWSYGWYEDKAADLALEMNEIFNRHKTKRVPVDAPAIKKFRRLYKEWLSV